jgi:cell division protein FtsL
MSRSAAATTAGRARTVRRVTPPAPRRVSGPVAPPRRDDGRPARPPRARIDARALATADGAVVERYGALPARRVRTAPAASRQPRLAYGGVAIASRMAGVALDVSASRFMDRVVRGRVWIGVIAFSLIGLVAMQVSMLKLNSGIGRAVQTISTLERSNSALRSDVTRLSAGERIQPLAEAQGFVMPAPADVDYLRAGDRHDVAVRAERRMRAPDPAAAGFAGSATPQDLDVAAMTGATTGAPASGATATLAPTAPVAAIPTTPTTAPAPTAATAPVAPAPATVAAVAPSTTPAPVAAPAAQQAAAPADPGSGGASPQQATVQTP